MKLNVKGVFIGLFLILLLSCRKELKFQTGDIIFHTSKSSQSKAIQLATDSQYSHVGLIYVKENKLFVLEAVQPVKFTPLQEWIERGVNKKFVVKRLQNSNKIFTRESQNKVTIIAEEFLGKDYDPYFEWSDDRIYCSELVWKIYERVFNIELGKLKELSDFDLSNPIVKEKLRERYGNDVPLDEKVISPGDIFECELLEEVKF